jgi:hypothetical protein
LWQTVAFEGFAEVLKVVPCGVRFDETSCHAEAGAVVGGEHQGLLGGGRPPLVDGAIMLPELADVGAAKTPIGACFGFELRDEMSEMVFNIILDRRTGSLEAMQPLHFVGDELEIRWNLQGQETHEEFDDMSGPCLAMVAATGRGLIARLVL